MTKNDGGQAFPSTYQLINAGGEQYQQHLTGGGMTLRDWFAGMALQGWLASWPESQPEMTQESEQKLCEFTYRLADAMIAEREKQ